MDRGNRRAERSAIGWIASSGASIGAAAGLGTIAPRLFVAASRTDADAALMHLLLALTCIVTAVLCAYLALVSILAAHCRIVDPGTVSGRVALRALRILAPRIARRISATALTASAAVLVAPPLVAAPAPHDAPAVSVSSEAPISLAWSGSPAPSLGWAPEVADEPARIADLAPATAPTSASAPASAHGQTHSTEPTTAPEPTTALEPTSSAGPSAVTVRSGDSLWLIADRILGPGADDPIQIHRLVRALHETNRAVIGPDPDRLEPGQVLLIPSTSSHRTAQELP